MSLHWSPSSDKNGVAFKWVKGAAKNKIIASDACLRSADDQHEIWDVFLSFGKSDHHLKKFKSCYRKTLGAQVDYAIRGIHSALMVFVDFQGSMFGEFCFN